MQQDQFPPTEMPRRPTPLPRGFEMPRRPTPRATGMGDQSTPDAFSAWVHGTPKCGPGETGGVYQTMGYAVVVCILAGSVRNIMMFFDDKNNARSNSTRLGLGLLIAVQILGAYILFSHCKNCCCWTGLLKGFLLSTVSMLLSHLVYGDDNVSLESLR